MTFRFASLAGDAELLTAAAQESARITALDQNEMTYYRAENAALFEELTLRFRENGNLLS